MTGRIKWYDGAKGFGFISVEGQPDVFLHHSKLLISKVEKDRLKTMVGAELEFTLEQGERGPFAVDVRLKAGAPS